MAHPHDLPGPLERALADLMPGSPGDASVLLRAVAAAIPDPFFMKDRTGRWVYANRATLEVVERTEAQVLGRLDSEIYEDAATALALMATDQRIMDSGVPESVEERLQVRGRVRWFQSSKSPYRDARGEVVGLVCVARDITDRRRAEEARLAAEGRLRAVLESLSEGVLVADTSGRVLSWNPAAMEILGFQNERDWLIGLPEFGRFFEVCVPGGPAIALEDWPLARLVRGEAVPESIHEVRRLDTDWVRTLRFAGARTRGAGGQDLIVLSVTDLTAWERAATALRRSEARFRAIAERSTDVVVLYDEDMRVSFWSAGAEAVLGWTFEEMLGQPGLSLSHPDDRALMREALRAIRAPGAVHRLTLRGRRRDGTYRALDVVLRNQLHDPDVGAVVANGRDVTEQRSLEQQMRQAQKLESVGRLAGGVAHDFNNVLTVILSSVGVLREDLTAGDPVNPDDLREIHDAAMRARELTRHLLAFARKSVLTPVVLDLGELLRSSERMLRRLIGEDVKLVVDVAPGLWPVHADPGAIDQALMNLVVNARDAMPGGGRLVLEARNASVPEGGDAVLSGARAGDWVRLAVRDQGCGMPAEVLAHLFEPFFTTKEAGKGTGLGLATVHGIATQAGGHVHVESTPGQGSTFTICLPRCHGAVAAVAAPAQRPDPRGTETVLVVEDDGLVRTVATRALTRAGYRVLEAPGGPEALAVAVGHDGPIHLLVTDVVLPGASGPEVAQALVALRPDLRTMYFSGHAHEALSRRGVLPSDVAFLAKPFSSDGLVATVRAVLDSEPA